MKICSVCAQEIVPRKGTKTGWIHQLKAEFIGNIKCWGKAIPKAHL